MSRPVIEVRNISKQYRLGKIGTGMLADDLRRAWAKMRGKEDPTLQLGDTNVRSQKSDSDYVWALRDVSFDVMKGEVLGIIGTNGAGKSTLLKILSQVTEPTIGSLKVKGRIASLLEVGTGFHPELTGRENVFLNGAILGMSKTEIRAKFDEIVDFSGVDRYIDTPVKRYSSGMKVRLGFAVAAYLDPEILIVDEVLAVGDAEFQRKCLGKMQDVSQQNGRTILFVSHNMKALQSLCTRVVWLEDGTKKKEGDVKEVINEYLYNTITATQNRIVYDDTNAPGTDAVKIMEIAATNLTRPSEEKFYITDEIGLEFRIVNKAIKGPFNLSLHLFTADDLHVLNVVSPVMEPTPGEYVFHCRIPANFLNDIAYYIKLMVIENSRNIFSISNAISFEIGEEKRDVLWFGQWKGIVRPAFEWNVEKR